MRADAGEQVEQLRALSAALILFLAFAPLASAPDTDVKVLATGLGVGILLDATLVRALLVPALVSLLGRWNWWFPRPVARVLRVAPPQPQPQPAVETAGSRNFGNALHG